MKETEEEIDKVKQLHSFLHSKGYLNDDESSAYVVSIIMHEPSTAYILLHIFRISQRQGVVQQVPPVFVSERTGKCCTKDLRT
jgi:hypothetical protein